MKDTCIVANKSAGRVGYSIPELNVRREFMPHEIKRNISVRELEALAQRPGGRNTLFNYLQVRDPEVINYLLNGTPPVEYWLNEKDIPNWMKSCSLEEFQDALDFAPDGTKDLIKSYAVSMPLTDTNKITAIKQQLGYDVESAIRLSHAYDEKSSTKVESTAKIGSTTNGRRATSSISVPETKETISIKEG